MKKIICLLFFAVICNIIYAQTEHMIPKEKWSKAFYISDEFCATKGLQPGETNGLLRVWNAADNRKDFFRLVDIRWYFSTAAEATEYLENNISELSEKGDPVSEKIEIDKVGNLSVYRENAEMRKLNEGLGIKNYMYYFLFTVKNYVAKVFVSSEKLTTAAKAVEYAKEAAKRLNAAAK